MHPLINHDWAEPELAKQRTSDHPLLFRPGWAARLAASASLAGRNTKLWVVLIRFPTSHSTAN